MLHEPSETVPLHKRDKLRHGKTGIRTFLRKPPAEPSGANSPHEPLPFSFLFPIFDGENDLAFGGRTGTTGSASCGRPQNCDPAWII